MAQAKSKVINRENYPNGLTISQYARWRRENNLTGKDYGAVRKALELGRITYNQHQLIDWETADEQWVAFRNDNLAHRAGEDSANQPLLSRQDPVWQERKAAADLLKAESEARIQELKKEEAEERLLDAGEVRIEIFSLFRTVRDGLLALPDRLSDRLSAMEETEEIERLLAKEIKQVCENLVWGGEGVDE